MHLKLCSSGDTGTVCLSYVGHENSKSMVQTARILYLEDKLSDVEFVRARWGLRSHFKQEPGRLIATISRDSQEVKRQMYDRMTLA